MKLSEFCTQFNLSPDVKTVGVDEYLIYFLICQGQIVYVGKSSEGGLSGRLRTHQADKEFDSYFTVNGIPDEAHALELEKGFISLLRPQYNKADVRMNIRAIQKVIQYVTAPRVIQGSPGGSELAASLTKQKAKLRAYKSKLRRGEGAEETNRSGAAVAQSEVDRLQAILSGQAIA